ncbi:hypothetical protein N9852_02810 [Alphaproteobacteria bacterium]|nr:hypothetical protein [Alphaproteobacteria bacterium]
MNKLKIPFAIVHLIVALILCWIFLSSDYVSARVFMFFNSDGPMMNNFSQNIYGFGIFYSPIAFLFSAYLLISKKIFLRKPFIVLNVLMSFVYIQLTYNFIQASQKLNVGFDIPLFSSYLTLTCLFISYRLYKDK